MHRVLIYSAVTLTLLAGVNCSRNREANARPSVADIAKEAPDQDHKTLEVTGCLASDAQTNQFVLTANSNALSSLTNRAAAGEAETYHYQLVGGNDLQAMVGKEVKVTGSVVGKGKDIDVKGAERTSNLPKASGTETTPAVKTTEEVEMQVERLNVTSVTPTGNPCSAPK